MTAKILTFPVLIDYRQPFQPIETLREQQKTYAEEVCEQQEIERFERKYRIYEDYL